MDLDTQFEPYVHRLYKVFKTVCEMLSDRGYAIQQDHLRYKEDFYAFTHLVASSHGKVINRQALSFTVIMRDAPTIMIVKFLPLGKVTITHIRQLMNELHSSDADSCLCIFQEEVTAAALNAMKTSTGLGRPIEYFADHELLYNPTRHFLVPAHVAISEEEKQAVFKKYGITNGSQLPRICPTDPIVRYYAFKPGQVIRIEQESETSGTYWTYRYCEPGLPFRKVRFIVSRR